jgi:hypothetical protein
VSFCCCFHLFDRLVVVLHLIVCFAFVRVALSVRLPFCYLFFKLFISLSRESWITRKPSRNKLEERFWDFFTKRLYKTILIITQ